MIAIVPRRFIASYFGSTSTIDKQVRHLFVDNSLHELVLILLPFA